MLVFAVAWTLLAGLAVLPVALRVSWPARLALAFCAGAFAISIEMFVFDLAGIGWRAWVILAPWPVLAGLRFFVTREKPTFDFTGLRPAHAILLAALIPLAVWWPYERLLPLTSQTWDSWAIWLFKAKAFFADGTVSGYLARAGEFEGQPGYPLLLPLYSTFLYTVAGEVSDHLAKIYSPLFFVALLGVFYAFARRAGSALSASALTVVVSVVPVVARVAFELPGYADTALSAYFVAGAGFLYFWLREGRLEDLAGTSIMATAAAWTKNEGQVFLLLAIVIGAFGLIRHKGSPRQWAVLIAPGTVLMALWSFVRSSHGVEAAGFAPGANFDFGLFALSAQTLIAKAFNPSLFALSFFVAIAAIALWKPLRGPVEFWVLPALVSAQLGAALLAYATGRNDIDWWLATSADRILVQVAPLAVMPAAVLFGVWAESEPVADQPKAKLTNKTGKSAKRKKHR